MEFYSLLIGQNIKYCFTHCVKNYEYNIKNKKNNL